MITKFRPKLYIKESNKIENIKGTREIEQSLRAWKYLETRRGLRHLDICRIQRIITVNQDDLEVNQRGYYRSVSMVNVSIDHYLTPRFEKVDSLMDNWLLELPKMTPLIGHIRFEYIYPFVDGNGQVGRMIYWWHCRQGGIPPILFTGKNRKNYYRLFDKDRIKNLKKSNWGIDFGRPKYEATIKLKDGKLVRGGFKSKPTKRMIKDNLPKDMKFDSIVKIKKINND